MFNFLPLVALVAVASAATVPRDFARNFPLSPSGRIIGGEDTTIEEVPYQISLRVYGMHYCGGAIISEHWIVTAGHCSDLPKAVYQVHAGSTFRTSGGSQHRVVAKVSHTQFGANTFGIPINDIALMRVNEPFVLDETRQPIALFGEYEEATAGKASTITGWGTTDGYSSPEVLQTVDIPIIAKRLCNKQYSNFGGLPAGQICAAYPNGGKDACQGDSGGPLAIDGRLAGIVSWGIGCAVPGQPGAYTEVASYRAWIKKHTGV